MPRGDTRRRSTSQRLEILARRLDELRVGRRDLERVRFTVDGFGGPERRLEGDCETCRVRNALSDDQLDDVVDTRGPGGVRIDSEDPRPERRGLERRIELDELFVGARVDDDLGVVLPRDQTDLEVECFASDERTDVDRRDRLALRVDLGDDRRRGRVEFGDQVELEPRHLQRLALRGRDPVCAGIRGLIECLFELGHRRSCGLADPGFGFGLGDGRVRDGIGRFVGDGIVCCRVGGDVGDGGNRVGDRRGRNRVDGGVRNRVGGHRADGSRIGRGIRSRRAACRRGQRSSEGDDDETVALHPRILRATPSSPHRCRPTVRTRCRSAAIAGGDRHPPILAERLA